MFARDLYNITPNCLSVDFKMGREKKFSQTYFFSEKIMVTLEWFTLNPISLDMMIYCWFKKNCLPDCEDMRVGVDIFNLEFMNVKIISSARQYP